MYTSVYVSLMNSLGHLKPFDRRPSLKGGQLSQRAARCGSAKDIERRSKNG